MFQDVQISKMYQDSTIAKFRFFFDEHVGKVCCFGPPELKGSTKLAFDFETLLRQCWDNFETLWGPCWDNFESMNGHIWCNNIVIFLNFVHRSGFPHIPMRFLASYRFPGPIWLRVKH